MSPPPDEADLGKLRELASRYDQAGLLGKAALQLRHKAPDAGERERLRRHTIGPEGRIAEDAIQAVRASDPIWALLSQLGLPEDTSVRELNHIQRYLVGRRPGRNDAVPDVSIRSARDPLRISVVGSIVPGALDPEAIDGYRYATLVDRSVGLVEPFLVLLHSRHSGDNDVVATLHLGATFLRYEQEFGLVDPDRLMTLGALVESDLIDIKQTHQALRQA